METGGGLSAEHSPVQCARRGENQACAGLSTRVPSCRDAALVRSAAGPAEVTVGATSTQDAEVDPLAVEAEDELVPLPEVADAAVPESLPAPLSATGVAVASADPEVPEELPLEEESERESLR